MISFPLRYMLYWKNNGHKIFFGDCLKVMEKMPSGSINLIVTDPHYNINLNYETKSFSDNKKEKEYLKEIEERMEQCFRILEKTGSMYLMNYPEINAKILPILEKLGFKLRRWLVWNYPTNIGHSKKNWTRSHRSILFLTKGKDYTFNRQHIIQHYKNPEVKKIKDRIKKGYKGRGSYDTLRFIDLIELQKGMIDVQEMNLSKNVTKTRQKGHPCQLPLTLLELLIKVSSNPKEIVLDPFAGSFSTSIVAKQLNRKSTGIDITKKYCLIGKRRMEKNG